MRTYMKVNMWRKRKIKDSGGFKFIDKYIR